jgi:hypothetical protein
LIALRHALLARQRKKFGNTDEALAKLLKKHKQLVRPGGQLKGTSPLVKKGGARAATERDHQSTR